MNSMLRLYAAYFACTLGAQETIHFASVGGRVQDRAGAAVEGAKVTVKHLATGAVQQTETGRDGRFRIAYLRVGEQEIQIEKAGYARLGRRLDASMGAAYELQFELKEGSAETSVTVVGEAAALEAARSQISATVSRSDVDSLPVNGRSFLEMALLAPGVAPTNTGSNQLFAETSAVAGQGISVGGQRNFSNNFVVDGLSANDDAAGLTGGFFGLDTVEELQVVTSGGQAEMGRALGGVVSVVTRSGTRELHGDLYGYLRNQRFNAASPLSNTKLPLTQTQYGASLGGPVVAGKTFYFGNFEQRRLNQSGLVTIAPANVALVNRRLDEVGYAGPRIATGIYPNPVKMTMGLGKVDHQFGPKDQFSVRFHSYDVSSRNSRGAGGLSDASASSGLENRDRSIALSHIHTIGARTVNEARGQFSENSLEAQPSDPVGPAVSIAGVATFGRLSGSPTSRNNRLVEVVENLSHRAGAHAARVGVQFLDNRTDIEFPRARRGSYAFSSMANFLAGVYNNAGFTQTFGPERVSQANPNLGVYAQDEWKLSRTLTLNVGLRYDLQWIETVRTDRNNVSPRAGFAWSPGVRGRTVIRGGAGWFYDRVPLRAVANALLSSGNTTEITAASQLNLSVSPAQSGAPVFPSILTTAPAPGLVNFTTMDRNMQNAYSDQRSLEVEHQLGRGASFRVGYQYVRGLRLIVSMNQNVPSCVAAGSNNGCRPNPAYANNSQYRGQADSKTNALHVSFQQRAAKWGGYRIAYTYSSAKNNVGEFFFSSPIDPHNLWRDYGRSDDDQRHRVVFHGTLHSHGFDFSSMLQYYAALPLNITTGATTVQGTAGRPLTNGEFIARNAGIGNDLFSVQARVSRVIKLNERVRLEALMEGFNALNHRNNLTKNGVFGTGAYPGNPGASFGQVTAVQDPRALQTALRLRF